MAHLDNYGDDPQGLEMEGLGDAAYDKIEDKAEEKAKEAAENAAKKAGKLADKLTDKIGPVKQAKDFVKNKISAVKKFKDKIKKGVKNLAKNGIKAVGRAAAHLARGLLSLMAANPLLAIIIIIVVILLISFLKNVDFESIVGEQDDSILLDSPVYVNVDGLMDDDVVVLLMSDCVTQQYDSLGELDAEKEALAKQLYSVFHSYGLNNASIAGMFGCLDKESGFDPSAIEGIFSEYGFLGTKKAQALLDLSNYTEHTLFPNYVKNDVSINKDGYKVIDREGNTLYYCGIGLPQFTGPAAYDLIRTAKTLEMDWYSMDFQIAYMESDCIYRPGFFSGWVSAQEEGLDDEDDPDYEDSWVDAARASAEKFALGYEGVPESRDDMIEERKNIAENWFGIIKDWGDDQVDTEYVDSITALSTELGGVINFVELEKLNFRCTNGNIFDNSSIANAAVSFAWPTRDQSWNNGTNLYQVVHDGVWPGDLVYKACDRCVSMAVRWSGSDDTYPNGTSVQLSYLSGSAKWEFVGMSNEVSVDDLLPGDIFVLSGHTFIYTGSSAIQAAYAGEAAANSDSVSASLGQRSAACDSSASGMINNNGGMDWDGRGAYYIYRCCSPDNSDTYSSIGSGVSE